MKTCTKCDESKPLTEFGREAKAKGGVSAQCKECCRARKRGTYAANRDRVLARNKAWRDAHPEKIAARNKAYREANSERVAAQEKAWREANREAIQARKKAWREANRDKINEYRARRNETDPAYRAQRKAARIRRKRLLDGAIQEPYTRESIFARDGWICGICDQPIDSTLRSPDPDSASIDHVVPLSAGGDDTPANVQAAHYGCNSRKHARVESEALHG